MTTRSPRLSVITDWRVDERALPDLAPGDEYERVITPQKFVVLHQVVVRGPILVNLRIGAVLDVPFELESSDGEVHRYRPKELRARSFDRLLAAAGAAAVSQSAVAIPPGMDVWLALRNEGTDPTKPRAALLVQEENT